MARKRRERGGVEGRERGRNEVWDERETLGKMRYEKREGGKEGETFKNEEFGRKEEGTIH